MSFVSRLLGIGPQSSLPPPALAYLAFISVVGIAASLIAWGRILQPTGVTVTLVVSGLSLAGLVVALGLRPLEIAPNEKVNVGNAVMFAGALLLGAAAPLPVLIGSFVANLLVRRPLVDAFFNASQYALATAAAAIAPPDVRRMSYEAALRTILAAGLFFLVNTGAVAGIASLARRHSIAETWRDIAAMTIVPEGCLLSIGALLAVLAMDYPLAIIFLVMPLSLTIHAYRQAALARSRAARVEELLAMQRRFIANAAHELRTPVTAIRGNAELALSEARRSNGEASAAALDDIAAESIRLGKLVSDLLLLSQSDERRPIERAPVDLLDLVESVMRRSRAINPGVALRLRHVEDAATVGDYDLIQQVVLELLDNAMKYTDPGGAVDVSLNRYSNWVEIRVWDSGIGISATDLPHIFDRFYRASAARSRARGSGLGLSNARWIAEAHGGRITVDSRPGSGTTFSLWLPTSASPPPSLPESG